MRNITVDGDTLNEFGINVLTGEACVLSMRTLCELTPEAMQTYLEYTGIKADINSIPKSDWNHRDQYSVFLTREVMEDLVIMTLMKTEEVVNEIIPNETECKNAGVFGYRHLLTGTMEDVNNELTKHEHLYSKFIWNKEKGEYIKVNGLYDIGRRYNIYNQQPHKSFSNVHGFTGNSQ